MQIISQVPRLPDRPVDAHKGMMGRIVVIAGSLGEYGFLGAPALTANACLRSGAGLVQIVTQKSAQPFVNLLAPCATTRAMPDKDADLARLAVDFGADVVAAGPGLADTVSAAQLQHLLDTFSGKVVLDADALNSLAAGGRWRARWPHNVVITPHPGEMRRLIEGWGLKLDVHDRPGCAAGFATEAGVTVVLKGAGTVVTDGQRVYINQTGNAGMATAGAGDVLTGVIAGLCGQRMDAFDAAVLGVHLHGLTGDTAAEELGRTALTALDLLDFLPEVFSDLEHHGGE